MRWKSYKKDFQTDGRFRAWASIKVKECYEKDTEDTGRLSIAQDILPKSTNFNLGVRVPSLSLLSACVHTLTCRTHIFLLHSLSAHIRTSSCVCTYTHGSRSPKKVQCTCVISLHLAFALLIFHLCVLFLHGHFETNPDCDLTATST